MLGVHVAIFALVSVVFGCYIFKDVFPVFTWLGILLTVAGGAVVQFGRQ